MAEQQHKRLEQLANKMIDGTINPREEHEFKELYALIREEDTE